MDLTRFVGSADDDHMDQGDAVKALEGVAVVVGRLSNSPRTTPTAGARFERGILVERSDQEAA
ncbi:hypothetical protein [Kitasatospora putterlickiae]|uniref:hypothetical protein n=1 Tax=Kitasatospora putterlickiae TaxID=221725 RepID=UPI0031D6B6D5